MSRGIMAFWYAPNFEPACECISKAPSLPASYLCELSPGKAPYCGRCRTEWRLRACVPPESFFAWARAEVQACENSGWKDDAYVGAGFRLGALRDYLKRVGVPAKGAVS